MGETRKLRLEEYVASPEKKQRYVSKLFDTIASRYDFFTAAMSYGMDRGWKRRLIDMAGFTGGELVLDLACGTGDITFAAGRQLKTGWAVGLDITPAMLEIAERKRHQQSGARVSFHLADIMRLPFEPETFERVTAGYALRNVPDIPVALSEIYRVLKPGGRFLSLDFGHPASALYRRAYFWYLTVVGSAAGLALHGDADTYRYISESLKIYPGQSGVESLMQSAGFVETGFRQFGGGIMAINYGTRPKKG